MKHLKPTSEYHRNLWINRYNQRQLPKYLKYMITVEQACQWLDWVEANFIKGRVAWTPKDQGRFEYRLYTNGELWEQYQQFLGKKTQTDKK